jgi:tRNA nucleotidyltransferase/poly(A) polymerase
MSWDTTIVTVLFGSGGLIAVLKFIRDSSKRNEEFKGLLKSVKRLELLHLLDHKTKDAETICSVYDEYKELGGNSYLDEHFKEWRKAHLTKRDK